MDGRRRRRSSATSENRSARSNRVAKIRSHMLEVFAEVFARARVDDRERRGDRELPPPKLNEYRDGLIAVDKDGKQGRLRDLLNDAETSLGRRDPDGAVKKLNEFVTGFNSLKAEMALGSAEDRILEVRKVLEQFRKQLALVPSDTPHISPISDKLDQLDSEAADLRGMVISVRKGAGSAAELETRIKAFSEKWDEFSSFYSIAKLVLDELAKTRRFEGFVRNSENMDHSIGKSAALTHLSAANEHLQESLRRLCTKAIPRQRSANSVRRSKISWARSRSSI